MLTFDYDIVSPFPPESYPLAYEWLREFPESNFDDYGPRDLAEFVAAMEQRAAVERSWGVLVDGKLCGIVAYLPYTPRSGTFHGICLAKTVHGSGLAQRAVKDVLAELFASGVEKVSASFFAANQRVRKFLAGLGAVDEGLMKRHTLQHGTPIDMRLMAFFKDKE